MDAREHYDRLIDEGNDPFRDPPAAQEYMARWDGPLFFKALGDVKGKLELEVGVGTGRLARQVLDRGCEHLTGIDLSPKTIERAKQNLHSYPNIELLVADIESFVRPDSFDLAYSVLTFAHIPNKQKALANVVACLRAGGRVVLSIEEVGPHFDFGERRVQLYPAPSEQYAAWLQGLGCKVEPPLDLIDRWISPDGKKESTYGKRIATLIAAAKEG